MTSLIHGVLSHPRTERFILLLIVINAIGLGLETDARVVAAIGPQLVWMDRIILTVFVIELLAKFLVFGWRFFRDPWNVFDFVVVSIALVPTSGPLTVLRALRVLRILRLITILPSLKRVVGALLGALPGMGSIVLLLLLIFYVGSVMATKLFGGSFPEWFGSVADSAYTLFQVMTLESWSMGIVRPVMDTYPYAWLFFIPFILATSFTALNLFIGVVVNAMQEEIQAGREQAVEDAVIRGEEPLLVEIRTLQQEVVAMREALQRMELRSGSG